MEVHSEFRSFLVTEGCEEALWKILCKLDRQNPKPEDPVDYIRQNIDPELSANLTALETEFDAKIESFVEMAYDYPKAYKKFLKWKAGRSKKMKSKGPSKSQRIIEEKLYALENPLGAISEVSEGMLDSITEESGSQKADDDLETKSGKSGKNSKSGKNDKKSTESKTSGKKSNEKKLNDKKSPKKEKKSTK